MDAGVRARGGEETSAVSVDSAWQQFVAENILFYTSLLKLLLLRSLVEFSFHFNIECARKCYESGSGTFFCWSVPE
jgi:hypothetical protein